MTVKIASLFAATMFLSLAAVSSAHAEDVPIPVQVNIHISPDLKIIDEILNYTFKVLESPLSYICPTFRVAGISQILAIKPPKPDITSYGISLTLEIAGYGRDSSTGITGLGIYSIYYDNYTPQSECPIK